MSDWHTVVCIATGRSLTLEQCELVRQWQENGGCKVIAINDAYLWAPWADILYFADVPWMQWQREGIDRPLLGLTAGQVRERYESFAGERISIDNDGKLHHDQRVAVYKNLSLVGGTMGRLSDTPGALYSGQNSGYQAMQIGPLRGAKRIVLLAYDMKVVHGKPAHFFGEHPVPTHPETLRQFRMEYVRCVPNAQARGIEILNASPDSDLEAFPMVSLEKVIDERLEARV